MPTTIAPTKQRVTKASAARAEVKAERFSQETKVEAARKREQMRAVKMYLVHLETNRRRVDPERAQARLDEVKAKLVTASGFEKLQLIQQRITLEDQLESAAGEVDPEAMEQNFIGCIKEVAERKGLGRQALLEAGVSAKVLKLAGL